MQIKQDSFTELLDKTKESFSDICPFIFQNTLLILQLILLKETVNLHKLKNHVGSFFGNLDREPSSHYRRLTRFFCGHFQQYVLWKLLLSWSVSLLWEKIEKQKAEKILLLDATSWALGTCKIQFLVLSVLYQGISIPIFWVNLSKKGHSNFSERKRLFQMAMCLYDLEGFTLLADREYIGKDWFDWLDTQGIKFIIRLPYKCYYKEVLKGEVSYEKLVQKARKGKYVETKVSIKGKVFRLVATLAPKDEHQLLLLMTNEKAHKTRKICNLYRKRWKIETMFLHWKSNGLHIEDINFKNERKIRLMLAFVIAAYILCLTQGITKLKNIPRKKSGNGSLYFSVFAKGYESIAKYLNNFVLFLDEINRIFKVKKKKRKPK